MEEFVGVVVMSELGWMYWIVIEGLWMECIHNIDGFDGPRWIICNG